MSDAAFGQLTSWDDAVPTGGGEYLNMKEDGDYYMRFLIGVPYEYRVHWIEGPSGKMVKLKCAGPDCMLCAKGPEFRAKVTFLAPVLNRATGRCQLLEFGRQIFNQLKDYAKNPKWGDIRGYDILVTKKKGGKPNVYNVMAEPPVSAMTEEETAMVNDYLTNKIDLDELAAPGDNDTNRRRLEGSDDGFSVSSGASFKQTSTSNTFSAPAATEGEMPAFNFPEFK